MHNSTVTALAHVYFLIIISALGPVPPSYALCCGSHADSPYQTRKTAREIGRSLTKEQTSSLLQAFDLHLQTMNTCKLRSCFVATFADTEEKQMPKNVTFRMLDETAAHPAAVTLCGLLRPLIPADRTQTLNRLLEIACTVNAHETQRELLQLQGCLAHAPAALQVCARHPEVDSETLDLICGQSSVNATQIRNALSAALYVDNSACAMHLLRSQSSAIPDSFISRALLSALRSKECLPFVEAVLSEYIHKIDQDSLAAALIRAAANAYPLPLIEVIADRLQGHPSLWQAAAAAAEISEPHGDETARYLLSLCRDHGDRLPDALCVLLRNLKVETIAALDRIHPVPAQRFAQALELLAASTPPIPGGIDKMRKLLVKALISKDCDLPALQSHLPFEHENHVPRQKHGTVFSKNQQNISFLNAPARADSPIFLDNTGLGMAFEVHSMADSVHMTVLAYLKMRYFQPPSYRCAKQILKTRIRAYYPVSAWPACFTGKASRHNAFLREKISALFDKLKTDEHFYDLYRIHLPLVVMYLEDDGNDWPQGLKHPVQRWGLYISGGIIEATHAFDELPPGAAASGIHDLSLSCTKGIYERLTGTGLIPVADHILAQVLSPAIDAKLFQVRLQNLCSGGLSEFIAPSQRFADLEEAYDTVCARIRKRAGILNVDAAMVEAYLHTLKEPEFIVLMAPYVRSHSHA